MLSSLNARMLDPRTSVLAWDNVLGSAARLPLKGHNASDPVIMLVWQQEEGHSSSWLDMVVACKVQVI